MKRHVRFTLLFAVSQTLLYTTIAAVSGALELSIRRVLSYLLIAGMVGFAVAVVRQRTFVQEKKK